MFDSTPNKRTITRLFGRQWLTVSIIVAIAGGLSIFQAQLQPIFEFNRDLIANGQYWRLLTGNFLHTNGWHLTFNLAGLILIHQLFGQYYSAKSLVAFTVFNCTAVGLLLFFFSPDIFYYVGLSGFLHGLFVAGCLAEITRGIKFSYLLLLGVSAKILFEQTSGATAQMSELINATIAVDAHLYGAVAALPMFAVYWAFHHLTSKLLTGK